MDRGYLREHRYIVREREKALPTYLGDVEIVGSASCRITGVNDKHNTIGWINITANHICIKLTGREL